MESPRVIAFYLPQFSPTPENDVWWGKGFTEWTNVAKGKPQFKGHYQPHIPADLGFYDLRLSEVREEQAALARSHGVTGFCYYHYWFHGRRMLEGVFEEVLSSGKPDLPFCLCWANETWRKTWNKGQNEVLIEQTYSEADDEEHIKYLANVFKDPRYIRVNGRPLFVVYRPEMIEGRVERMLEIWNRHLQSVGIPELYLCSVRMPPLPGFEASVDFYPPKSLDTSIFDKVKWKLRQIFSKNKPFVRKEYHDVVSREIAKPYPDYKTFFCPVPNWDNSARRSFGGAFILNESSPDEFRRWFQHCVKETVKRFKGEERIVFINAWNEWGEGAHLEPDQKWGSAYLEAIRDVLGSVDEFGSLGERAPHTFEPADETT